MLWHAAGIRHAAMNAFGGGVKFASLIPEEMHWRFPETTIDLDAMQAAFDAF